MGTVQSCDTAAEDLATCEAELKSCQETPADCNDIQAQLDEVKANLIDTELQLQTTETTLDECRGTRDDLQTLVNNSNVALSGFADTVSDLRDEVEAYESENFTLQSNWEACQQQQARDSTTIEDLTRTIEDHKQTINEQAQTINGHVQDMDDLQNAHVEDIKSLEMAKMKIYEQFKTCEVQRDSLYRYSNVDDIHVNQSVNAPLTSAPIPLGATFSIPADGEPLPTGLTVDETTGTIKGTPTQTKTFADYTVEMKEEGATEAYVRAKVSFEVKN